MIVEELICMWCNERFIAGDYCSKSATEKHIAITDDRNCVYCGNEFKPFEKCKDSPTKIHSLQ